jgi:hypothetical protein
LYEKIEGNKIMLISIVFGGIFVFLIVLSIFINNLLKDKIQLYNDLYKSVLSYCYSTIAHTSSIDEILKEGIEEGIPADSKIVVINKKLHEVMYERNTNLYLKISKSNTLIILGNILVIIKKYRSLNNVTKEQEDIIFNQIYDCINKPNIGLIVITRELNAI